MYIYTHTRTHAHTAHLCSFITFNIWTYRYVPALRELRQHALVLVFPPTLQSRLSHRLQEVCRREKLRASIPALTALCDKADNDIRSCLNTLQVCRHACIHFMVGPVSSNHYAKRPRLLRHTIHILDTELYVV